MFKKIQLGLLICCMGTTSYAYIITNTLSIENRTDMPMVINIEQHGNQQPITKEIPAHNVTQVETENSYGAHTGWLYQTDLAPFTISSATNKTPYISGRIAYYVGSAGWKKYSFLNSVSSAEDVQVDTNYSCKSGGSAGKFANTLIIEGTPANNSVHAKAISDTLRCEGIKSSVLDPKTEDYSITCSDDTNSLFHPWFLHVCGNVDCFWSFHYSNGEDIYSPAYTKNLTILYADLNNIIGKKFCGSW